MCELPATLPLLPCRLQAARRALSGAPTAAAKLRAADGAAAAAVLELLAVRQALSGAPLLPPSRELPTALPLLPCWLYAGCWRRDGRPRVYLMHFFL